MTPDPFQICILHSAFCLSIAARLEKRQPYRGAHLSFF